MNFEYVENKHSDDKNRFIGEEFTYIAENFLNGDSFGQTLATTARLRNRINENRE